MCLFFLDCFAVSFSIILFVCKVPVRSCFVREVFSVYLCHFKNGGPSCGVFCLGQNLTFH